VNDKPLRICSVDLRDGQQSLLATRVKTEDILPILEKMDSVGFDRAEVWGGATFDVCIRYLNEDPWDRLREIKKRMVRTPLSMLLRGQNLVGFRHYPDDIVERFVDKAADAGMDIFLIFDILNDLRNCETAIRAVKKAGKIAEGQLSHAIGPIYDMEMWTRIAKQFEDMGVSSIHVEDGAGIITPAMAFELIKVLKEAVKIPIHLHCHSTGGLAALAYWEAIKAGVDVIDTDMSALSMGTAHPPTESFVVALKDSPRDTGFDLGLLEEINRYFLHIRDKYREFESRFTGVDIGVFRHHVPGGMLSNLESQLKQMGISDRLDKVLEEVHLVRKEFGYPPLGTPLAQIVGAQATMNVLTGERYKMVAKETKDYIMGLYGKPPGQIDPEVEKRVLGSEKKFTCRPADLLEPAFERLKAEVGDLARNDEDVLTYVMFPNIAKEFLTKKYQLESE
jgi:pyruvate/oxaloacetate carboxyltransferase